jgi:CRP-like cAMP-binding protein
VLQITFRLCPCGTPCYAFASPHGVPLKEAGNYPGTDLDRLSRLEALSWLSNRELSSLAGALAFDDFKRSQIMFRQVALASDAHILLKGIARITCQNARSERVTVALLAPGPIPGFPSLPGSQFDFRCEAYNNCRVGSLSWDDFNGITEHGSAALRKFHERDLQQWYRMLLRSSDFLNLDLNERIVIALLELSADFGIKELRGTLLIASFSHQDIADLVGASRPRVTEHLARLEREHLIVRQGRQLIVLVEEMQSPSRYREREKQVHHQILQAHPSSKNHFS